MVRIERAVLVVLASSVAILVGVGGGSRGRPGTPSDRDPVEFQRPIVVDPPDVLLGASGDPRCPADPPNQPCLKDVDDLLFGRTFLQRTDDLVFGFQGGRALLETVNSGISRSSVGGVATSSVPFVLGARLFDLPHDYVVVLYFEPGDDNPNPSRLHWRIEGAGLASPVSGAVEFDAGGFLSNTVTLVATTGDYTNDGLDEVVVFFRDFVPPPAGDFDTFNAAIVATAADRNDPTQGLRFGPEIPGNFAPKPTKVARAIVQGRPRLLITSPSAQNFEEGEITDCIPNTGGFAGLAIQSAAINADLSWNDFGNAETAIIEDGQTANQCWLNVNLPGQAGNADITVGRFSTSLHDQALVAYGFAGGTVKILPIDIDPQGNLVAKPVLDTGLPVGGGSIHIRAGRFDWTSPVDQAALLVSNAFGAPGINTLRILRFDTNFVPTVGPVFQAGATSNECANDMVVGNFDRFMINTMPPPPVIADPDMQVAIPFNDCSNQLRLRFFDVNAATGAITNTNTEFDSSMPGNVLLSSLVTADLQGRSNRLGPPDVVTINKRQQASLVLAAPPMHVDAVVPDGGTDLAPTNITAAPHGFHAGFTFEGQTDQSSEITNGATTSYSIKESTETKATFGDCDFGDCASADFKFQAQQAKDTSSDTLTGSYAGNTSTVSATTGFTDLVSFQSETFTIYVYPVIGRKGCPVGNPSCSNPSPLTLNMAGPDTLSFKELQGGNAYPWYQPPWIPGNILSYPGNLTQLQAALPPTPAFQSLSQADAWLTTSGGTSNASATWTQAGTMGTTTNTKTNYSFDGSISVSGEVGVSFANVETSVGIDAGGSFGFSTLTDGSKKVSATQGIQFTRTADFEDTAYAYEVTPHIFGLQQPAHQVDVSTVPADVQTYSALRTAHVVNFPDDGSGFGTFWGDWYGQAPDVALNHPLRWTVRLTANDTGDGNCQIFDEQSSDFDCATLSPRLPVMSGRTNIWGSQFHYMRGLFITGPSGQGPQLTTATQNDVLTLTGRVYNLSLAEFPANAQVKVRFMAFPWSTSTSMPAGPSFQIGADHTLGGGQLPPFDPLSDHPNWILVPQAFDTSGTNCGGQSCANLDLVFWVAVWVETGSGALGTEIAAHGMRSIPAPGEDFLAVAAREQAYSNNLGLYNQVFHIFPATRLAQAPTPEEGEIGAQITHAGSADRQLERGEHTLLAVKVRTGGQALQGGLDVAFYDGDPNAGGALIGFQYLPHLDANETHDFRVPFQSDVCGKHEIFVVAGDDTRHEHTAKLRPIVVAGRECARGRGHDDDDDDDDHGRGHGHGRGHDRDRHDHHDRHDRR